MVDVALAGRVVRTVEPLHSMVYFAPEAAEVYPQIGLKPGGMGYFASRSAAMGAVAGGVVTATFYNFAPDLVARHIPLAWSLATPADVLAARSEVAERALTRLLGAEALASAELAELTGLLRKASQGCRPEGHPLYAAHADLPWPEGSSLSLWHAITLLREHRGDGHIAALVTAGFSGLQAIALHTLTGHGFLEPFAKASRGWSAEQWAGAIGALTDRGLVADGSLTEHGKTVRREVENVTDQADASVYAHLSTEQIERIISLGGKFRGELVSAGAFPANVFADLDRVGGQTFR